MTVGRLRLALLLIALPVGGSRAGDPLPVPEVFAKAVPESIEDLKQIEQHVRSITARVTPATVGIRIGPSSGSGVIIDRAGYVLTAGHVSGQPNRDCEIILPSGKKHKGRTLGANRGVDSGLIKITGTWCLAIGHPNGYQTGRAPVVRFGRVQDKNHDFLRTDCALVGGDSGGPLFDMRGRVIGIHSRIGGSMTANIHVPVDSYRESWDRLANAEVWGNALFVTASHNAYLGVTMDDEKRGCKLAVIAPGSPAEKAGLKFDDQILRVDGQLIQNGEDLVQLIRGRRPGQEISLEVVRGRALLRIGVTLEKRPSS